jgi:hypothetical protein
MDDTQITTILAKTRPLAAEGEFEKFKTSEKFDGTTRNPHWLTTSQV